jgi:hypothetical protein
VIKTSRHTPAFRRVAQAFAIAVVSAASALSSVFEVKAQDDNVVCPASGTQPNLGALPINEGWCSGTPEKYQLIIYEMGLCTSNPTSAHVFDPGSCSPTFKNESGQIVDLAGGSVIDLGSSEQSDLSRPDNASYPYAYIVISNRFTIRSQWSNTGGGTYYSNPNTPGNISLTAPSLEFVHNLNSFDETFDPVYPAINVRGGTLAALLLKVDLTPALNEGEVDRLVGTFRPGESLLIDESVKGLKVELTVTNSGLNVIAGTNPGDRTGPPDNPSTFECFQQPCAFSSGPFQPTFTLIK